MSITYAAKHLGVSRTTLQRVVDGMTDVSADMAYRLGAAFGTSAEMWAGIQMQHDLFKASKVKRPLIKQIREE